MGKKGQLTVFIILGIIILGTVLGAVYLSGELKKRGLETEEEKIRGGGEAAAVKLFTENCLRRGVVEGMYQVLGKGGYYQFPLETEVFEFVEEEDKFELPYYFSEKKAKLPNLGLIEKETARGAEDFFESCIGDWESFRSRGYQIEGGEAKIRINFGEGKTKAELSYPLTIKIGEKEIKLKDFSESVPFDFREKYEMVQNYFSEQGKDPDYFLVGTLSSLAYEKDYGLGFEQFGEEGRTVLVELSYDEQLKEEPVVYSFALDYGWKEKGEEEIEIIPSSLQLEYLEAWEVTQPGQNTYQVKAKGDGLIYDTDPDSLEIDAKTGLIRMETKDFPNDEYLYYIGITDRDGRRTMGPLLIKVKVNTGNLPVIKEIGSLTAEVGKEFYYKVEVEKEDEEMLFTAESGLFEIDKKNGEIRFTPSKEDKGNHSVRVEVENKFGKMWERFELEIK